MTKAIFAGAVFAALVSFGVAQAQTCASSCTSQHATCSQSGKDYGTCMTAWRQCKTSCLTPARATSAAPAAKVAAVVRR